MFAIFVCFFIQGFLRGVALYCSSHSEILVDDACEAILKQFISTGKQAPRFRANGGSPRENLALQNVQVTKLFFLNVFKDFPELRRVYEW